MKKTEITLYSQNARLVKIIREELESRSTPLHVVGNDTPLPVSADLVISTAATNSRDEWTAARLGCFVAVVPESLDYIRGLLDRRGRLTLVGSDRGRS